MEIPSTDLDVGTTIKNNIRGWLLFQSFHWYSNPLFTQSHPAKDLPSIPF